MKIRFLSIISMIFLSSCASILNTPFQIVNIDNEPGIKVEVDTSKFYYKKSETYNVYIPKDYNSTSLFFLRSKTKISLIINDNDTLEIKPHRSYFSFWFANIYWTMGLGMLVDYDKDKCFEYPKYNYIAKAEGGYRNIRFKPIAQRSYRLNLTMPAVNLFYLQTDSDKIHSASGLGISGELNYFLKDKYYISFNAGATLNPFSPEPDSVDLNYHHYFNFKEISSSIYSNIRINKITPRLEYGVGLSLATLKWSSNNLIGSTDTTLFYSQSFYKSLNLGFSSSIALRLTPHLNFGVQYQPYFYDFRRREYTYQHFITTQLIWRF